MFGEDQKCQQKDPQLELRGVEQHLNRLCSQHDELMSLLDICEYIPNVRTLQHLNQQLSQKIILSEKRALQTLPAPQISLQTDQQQVSAKYEQYSSFLKRIEQTLSENMKELDKMTASLKPQLHSKSRDLEIQRGRMEMRETTEKMERRIAKDIATYRSKMRKRIAGKAETNENKQIILQEPVFKLEKLEHQIELQILQMEVPNLQEFCTFTCNRLQKQMADLQKENQYHCKTDIQYQIAGLKQFIAESLLIMYEQNQEKLSLTILEKELKIMVQNIEGLLNSGVWSHY